MEDHEETAEFVDSKTMARMLGVCPRTVANMRRRREIPYYRIGRRVLYIPEEVRRELQANNRVEALSLGSAQRAKSGVRSEKIPV